MKESRSLSNCSSHPLRLSSGFPEIPSQSELDDCSGFTIFTLAIKTISPCLVSPTFCEHLAKYLALKRMTESKIHNYAHINNLYSALRNSSGTGRFMSWSPFNSHILCLLISKTLVFIPLPKNYDLNSASLIQHSSAKSTLCPS